MSRESYNTELPSVTGAFAQGDGRHNSAAGVHREREGDTFECLPIRSLGRRVTLSTGGG